MSVRHINASDPQPHPSEHGICPYCHLKHKGLTCLAFKLWQQPPATEPATQEVIEIDESTGNIANVHTEPNPHSQPRATDTALLGVVSNIDRHLERPATRTPEQTPVTDDKQEWTPERVRCLFELRGYIYKEEGWKAISDEINAAITAHEQAWVKVLNNIASEYAQDMIAAQLELDAERENRKEAEREWWAMVQRIRHKHYTHYRDFCNVKGEVENLRQQLLGAEAAIAEIKRLHESYSMPVAMNQIWMVLRSVDLSALDKHDAIVRKPLVELLRSVHTWFMQQAPQHYNGCGLWISVDSELAEHPRENCILDLDSPTLPPDRDEYLQCGCRSCRDALAKVRYGNEN